MVALEVDQETIDLLILTRRLAPNDAGDPEAIGEALMSLTRDSGA